MHICIPHKRGIKTMASGTDISVPYEVLMGGCPYGFERTSHVFRPKKQLYALLKQNL